MGGSRGRRQRNWESRAVVGLGRRDISRQAKGREEYGTLRLDFQRVFNAQVPEFDVPRTRSAGLEGYPRALSRIVSGRFTPGIGTMSSPRARSQASAIWALETPCRAATLATASTIARFLGMFSAE